MDRRQFFKRTSGALVAAGLIRNDVAINEHESQSPPVHASGEVVYETLGDTGDPARWMYDKSRNTITTDIRPRIGDVIEITYDARGSEDSVIVGCEDSFQADGFCYAFTLSKPLLQHYGYVIRTVQKG